MSVPAGYIRCPRCGHLNPPNAKYCERCGYPLTGVGASSPTQVTPQAAAPAPGAAAPQQPPTAPSAAGTAVAAGTPPSPPPPAASPAPGAVAAAQQPQLSVPRPGGASTPRQCSGNPLPAPYYLVFPDGKRMVSFQQMCIYGREDFEGYIPQEYLRYITRRSNGGQFTIYCEVKDINTIVCYIADNFSTNPTYLNGQPIKGKGYIMLNHGDIISPAGMVNIRFYYANPPQPPSS